MMKPLSDKKLAMKANVQAMRDRAAARKQKAADFRAGQAERRAERLAARGKTLPQKKPFMVDDTGMKGQALYETPVNDMNRVEAYNKGGVVKKSKSSMDYRKTGTTLSTKDNRKKK